MYDCERIASALNSPYLVKCYDCVSSTNTVAKELAENGQKENTIVIASAQTNGRGRLGRSFFSPDNTGVYMSFLLYPDIAPNKALYITTAAAVAICEAIEEICGLSPKIKWVNDILINGKKVCGILTEGSLDSIGKMRYAVLGIGINLYSPKNDFPDEIKDIAGSLFDKEDKEKVYALITEIINRFFRYYEQLEEKTFLKPYIDKSAVVGKSVKVLQNQAERIVKVIGIDEEFSLIVENTDSKVEYLSSGEISTRLID